MTHPPHRVTRRGSAAVTAARRPRSAVAREAFHGPVDDRPVDDRWWQPAAARRARGSASRGGPGVGLFPRRPLGACRAGRVARTLPPAVNLSLRWASFLPRRCADDTPTAHRAAVARSGIRWRVAASDAIADDRECCGVSPGVVRRLLLVGVVVALTVIAIPTPGVAWAASNRSGVGAQVSTGQAATPPTAEQQQQQQQAAAAAAEAAQQAAVTGHASLPWARLGHPARLVIVRAGRSTPSRRGIWCSASCATVGRCHWAGWMPRSRPRG